MPARRLAPAALLLAAVLVVAAPGIATAATPVSVADCTWYPAAIELARSVDQAPGPRAAAIRDALARFDIGPDTALPAACSRSAESVPVAVPATGGTQVCEKFGSTPVADGRYEVQNNVWGSELPQCVRAFDTGFEVQEAQFTNTAGPASYPSIFTGCHYGTCTTATSLPRQVSALPTVTSSWSFTGTRTDEQWDAAYDIWFDPTPRRDGTVTGTEMMIWLDATAPKPIGEPTGTVELAGTTWEVWRGVNGAQVVSYVATTPTHAVRDLPLSSFFADAVTRGVVRPDWYLTSVQAGFEPWTGGAGLTTTAFAVTGVTTG